MSAAMWTWFVPLALRVVLGWLPIAHVPMGVKAVGGEVTPWLAQFTHWDAAHYVSIARDGYTYEQAYVFPYGFPWAIQIVRSVFVLVGQLLGFSPIPSVSDTDTLIMCGIVTSFVAALVAERALRSIGLSLGLSSQHVDDAALEALYAACCWWAIALAMQTPAEASIPLVHRHVQQPLAAVLFAAASGVRMNGCFNAVVVVMLLVRTVALRSTQSGVPVDDMIAGGERSERRTRRSVKVRDSSVPLIHSCGWNAHLWDVLWRVVSLVACLAPLYCADFGTDNTTGVPFSYRSLQARHWDVGFLSQFQLRQLPNFLLALPTAIVLGSATARYLRTAFALCVVRGRRGAIGVIRVRKGIQALGRALRGTELVLVVHGVLQSGVVLLIAHPQVLTRVMAAATPWLFFAVTASRSFAGAPRAAREGPSALAAWLVARLALLREYPMVGYAATYMIVGTALHANNFPFT